MLEIILQINSPRQMSANWPIFGVRNTSEPQIIRQFAKANSKCQLPFVAASGYTRAVLRSKLGADLAQMVLAHLPECPRVSELETMGLSQKLSKVSFPGRCNKSIIKAALFAECMEALRAHFSNSPANVREEILVLATLDFEMADAINRSSPMSYLRTGKCW
jgi:hypothetical protein